MTEPVWHPLDNASVEPAGRLAGRAIFLTGAAQGIGEAIARLFVAEGARVALIDRRGDAIRTLAGEIGGLAIACDVADPRSVENAVNDAVAAFGKLDGVVNAAGIHATGSLADTTPERFMEVLGVNLVGPFLVCRFSAPHLAAAPGATIVNLSSASALSPFPNRSAYAASKGGLVTLSKSIAMELAPDVRVNVLCPGLVDTPMARSTVNNIEAAGERYALKRVGRVEEVAQAALFLTSAASSFITGITLAVDGGRSFH